MMPSKDIGELHSCTLAQLKKGEKATITGLANVVEGGSCPLCRRLTELGFFQGENVFIVAESFPRRDPLAVRVGDATFALGRREADLVYVSRHIAQ